MTTDGSALPRALQQAPPAGGYTLGLTLPKGPILKNSQFKLQLAKAECPDNWDWREQGTVSSVKNQGQVRRRGGAMRTIAACHLEHSPASAQLGMVLARPCKVCSNAWASCMWVLLCTIKHADLLCVCHAMST
jgi:hypothetical protein